MTPFDDASGPDFGPPDAPPPLTMEERAGVLDDLAELEVFRTLLEHTGIKGIVVDCPDCDEEHHVDWALMQANLRQLLELQTGDVVTLATRVGDPATVRLADTLHAAIEEQGSPRRAVSSHSFFFSSSHDSPVRALTTRLAMRAIGSW